MLSILNTIIIAVSVLNDKGEVMTFNQLINIWTGSELLNVVIWFCLLILIMYLAKNPAHLTIRSFCHVISQGLSHMAESILSAVIKVKERNKEVLLAAGLEEAEKNIEMEFNRINTVVERDLSGFPVLKRQLQEQIARIEDDYQQSSDIPPAPPGWVDAVDALAKLPDEANENKAVTNILKEIHKTTCDQQKRALDEYRKAVSSHHIILNSLMPYWRKLTQTLDDVAKVITGIHERSVKIDKHMNQYEDIRANSDKAERTLSSSSMTQFFISGIALAIAIWGIAVNFNLIAVPMKEMVGASSYIGPMKTSDVVALVIILVEVSIGIYLMESLRITNLFPVIRQMDDKMRKRLFWFTIGFLLTLAFVEAALAFIRHGMYVDKAQTDNAIEEVAAMGASVTIPTISQMVLSFILPFVLTLTAIPLESFVYSSRTVLGVLTVFFMQLTAFLLNLSGSIITNCGELLINIYNLVVFPLIWAEDMLLNKLNKEPRPVMETKVKEPKLKSHKKSPGDSTIDSSESKEDLDENGLLTTGETAS